MRDLRTACLPAFTLSLLVITAFACGSEDSPAAPVADDGGTGTGNDAGMEPDAGEDAVVIETHDYVDLGNGSGGKRVDRPDLDHAKIVALVPAGDGYTPYEAVADGPSRWKIKGIPEGRYFLEFTARPSALLPNEPPTKYFLEQERKRGLQTIAYGTRWYAGERGKGAAGSWVKIDATNVAPWQADDRIELMSRHADVWRTASSVFDQEDPTQRSAPMPDATTLAGWEIDMLAMNDTHGYDLHLVEPNDDLVVVHSRRADANLATDPDDAWSRAILTRPIESFDAKGTAFVSGGVTAVSGRFAPVAERAFGLDLRGSKFVEAVRATNPTTNVRLSVIAVAEPGAQEELVIGFAPTLFDIAGASTRTAPVNPACYPATRSPCDLDTCPGGCTDETKTILPGDVRGTIRYGNPYASDAVELVVVNTSYSYIAKDPVTGESESRSRLANFTRRLSAVDGKAIEPALGLPTKITVGGELLPPDATATKGVGDAPLVEWTAPSLGAPEFYYVDLFDSDDAKGEGSYVAKRRQVARFTVRGTSVRFPSGLVREGHHYTILVTARRDGLRLEQPSLRSKSYTDSTQELSGIFTR